MKKSMVFILAGIMCVYLCSCGSPKSIGKACEKADTLVDEWDRKGKNVSGYFSEFRADANMYFVTTYSITAADETEFGKFSGAKYNCEFVYNELSKVFENVDVTIAVIVIDENQEAFYVTVDGKAIDLEELK